MKQAASLNDFRRMSGDALDRHEMALKNLHYLRLTCRVEVSGRDIQIVIAPGCPPAAYWLDRFDIEFDRSDRFVGN